MRSFSFLEFQLFLLDLLARHEVPLCELFDHLESLSELGIRRLLHRRRKMRLLVSIQLEGCDASWAG